MARLKSPRTPVLLALVLWGVLATPAYSACTLPDGPDNTLVPEGYRFAASGRWEICEKGAWTTGGTVSDARAFTANNTGVCLPLENQFTKKNGVISMNFVPEKSRRNFYGFEHECVASTWWRVPGGVTVSNPNPAIPDDPAPPAKPKTDPLADLNRLYDDVVQPAQPVAEEPPVATTELPSFSASDRATPAPSPAVPDVVPPPVLQPPPPAPARPDTTVRIENDYQACLTHCREGQAEHLSRAEAQCRSETPKPRNGRWNSQAERDYRRCRLLAAREVNNALRACLLPCKKQAGKNIWTGP